MLYLSIEYRASRTHSYIFQSMALPVNSSSVFTQPLLLYTDGYPVATNQFFTYKPNPIVDKIEPLSALVT